MFKDLELLAQVQKEEVERKALDAWKCQDEERGLLWRRVFKNWSSKRHRQKKQHINNNPAVR